MAFAGEHAEDLERVGGKTWRATFRLGSKEAAYGRALQLMQLREFRQASSGLGDQLRGTMEPTGLEREPRAGDPPGSTQVST